jgi:hypothetical protein
MLFFCDDYNPDIFVDRPTTLAEIRAWADMEQVEKRVCALVAPPGGGKSWLLERLRQVLNNPSKRFVVHLNVPDLVNLDEAKDRNRVINTERFREWFRKVQEDASAYFPISPISETPDISAITSAFVRLICNCNPDKAPLILVDGYDELSDLQAEVVSHRILQQFIERECIRMVIAHRPERSIKGDAIRRNLQDPPFFLHQRDPLSHDFAIQQFQRLVQSAKPEHTAPDPKAWMNKCAHYRQWNHPLANCYLFNRGLASGWAHLSSQDFYECCKVVIERPDKHGHNRFHPLSMEEFQTLHRIATELRDPSDHLLDDWSQADLESLLQINNMVFDPIVTKLFLLGLIISVPQIPVLYSICDGLRELLREITIDKVNFS